MLAAMADPDREFDAVVIGSSERAFYGHQFAAMAPLFDHYGVEVWVPELGGAIDPRTAGQEELMIPLGILSKREIARARIRTRAAMTVQTRDQGRYLGGRPPYGYRLIDAGPHPNRALALRAILTNPRYTGRQVRNRQRTDHDLVDPANTTLGHRDVMRWNTPTDWIISTRPAHPALVSEPDFITVRKLRTRRKTAPGRTYLLTGLLCCGVCGQRMESYWSHHRPGYRCRHGHTSATRPQPGRIPHAYLREDHVLPYLPARPCTSASPAT